MLLVMRRFEWTWVGLLFGNDEAGRDAARLLQSNLDQSGLGCVAYAEALPFDNDLAKLQRIVAVMKASTARVVIGFVYGIHMQALMEEVGASNCTLFLDRLDHRWPEWWVLTWLGVTI